MVGGGGRHDRPILAPENNDERESRYGHLNGNFVRALEKVADTSFARCFAAETARSSLSPFWRLVDGNGSGALATLSVATRVAL
jgi:hypothetical protein